MGDSTSALLPPEILFQIFSHVPYQTHPQPTLYASCLVSRSWYAAAVTFLYQRPYLKSKNFKQFVTTVCPSINAHIRKSELANMVRVLDMGNLVHDGSKSLTARLLGRVKEGLEELRAPQASFAVNSLAALSKCHSLRHLDLSLISASISLSSLFHSLQFLTNLTSFHFPRSSCHPEMARLAPRWPPNLKELYISGDLRDDITYYFSTVTSDLVLLEIDKCLHLSGDFIVRILSLLGHSLKSLKIGWNMPRVRQGSLDSILSLVPNITILNISTQFISLDFFANAAKYVPPPHPLSYLTIDSSSRRFNYTLPDPLWDAVCDGGFGKLRRLRFTGIVDWTRLDSAKKSLEELGQLFEALEREDGSTKGGETGVWVSEDEGYGTLAGLARLRSSEETSW